MEDLKRFKDVEELNTTLKDGDEIWYKYDHDKFTPHTVSIEGSQLDVICKSHTHHVSSFPMPVCNGNQEFIADYIRKCRQGEIW